MATWWWMSVPYTLFLGSRLFIRGDAWRMAHMGGGFLWALSWVSSLSSAGWTVASLIRMVITHTWSGKAITMLVLGLIAGLWLLQPLGFLKCPIGGLCG